MKRPCGADNLCSSLPPVIQNILVEGKNGRDLPSPTPSLTLLSKPHPLRLLRTLSRTPSFFFHHRAIPFVCEFGWISGTEV